MKASEPQRRGWLSWFRQSVWAPSQPEPASTTAREQASAAGSFFPFLKSNKLSQEARQQPQPQPTNDRSSSNESAAAAAKPTGRDGNRDGAGAEKTWSARGISADDEERQLERNLPLVWTFLREEEGWSFVDKSGGADVRGPEVKAAHVGGGGSGGAQQDGAGPMSQGQVG